MDAKVYSYEPQKDNYELMKENVCLNNLNKQITLFRYGIGATKGQKELFLSEDNTGAHSFYTGKKPKRENVDVITLKDVLCENEIVMCDFLKMDCEGAEFEILCSTDEETLKRIKTISLEFHESYGGGSAEELRVFLEKNGFQCFVDVKAPGLGYIYAEARE